MKKSRRGVSLIYSVFAVMALVGMATYGVDMGRVYLARTQLSVAADASARAAAASLGDATKVQTAAVTVASLNTVDGTGAVVDTTKDIVFMKWNPATHTGAAVSTGKRNSSTTNAVQITVIRSTARNGPIKLFWSPIIRSKDLTASSTAMLIRAINVNQNVSASANPFLSGMPAGAMASNNNPHNNPDKAASGNKTNQSPIVAGMDVTEGSQINFDTISGNARHDPNDGDFGPDGNPGDIGHNNNTSTHTNNYVPLTDGSSAADHKYDENGINTAIAPINALVGVFLDDNAPNTTAYPNKHLDFSTADSRNQLNYTPGLKQVFFIGDGKTSAGKVQNFQVPNGATRLFIATWDFYEWNNNEGTRNVKITKTAEIQTVK